MIRKKRARKRDKILKTFEAMVIKYRTLFIIAAHIFVFAASLVLAFLLKNDMRFQLYWMTTDFPVLLAFSLVIKMIVFAAFKQFQGWWRYVGILDLQTLSTAAFISTVIIYLSWMGCNTLVSYFPGMESTLNPILSFDQGIIILDLFTTIMLLSGLRLVVRLYYEEMRSEKAIKITNLLIVGAGDAGETLLREVLRMRVQKYNVIGLIDDDPAKRKVSIHGIPVIGTIDDLDLICEEYDVEEIAVAMPSAPQTQLRRIIQVSEGHKIKFSTVPSLTDITSGKLSVSQTREVDIADLLGREEVQLELDKIEEFLTGKTILVTGAGGSIGSEMCRQICPFKPKLLLLLEQAENPLFFIDRELKHKHPHVQTRALICNITDRERVSYLFANYRPDVVIHAAAHKHVPLMETNPGEPIKNNVLGTVNIANASDEYGAKSFVMISTDKAVNPTSLMGTSKRIAEMYIQSLNKNSKTHFVTVRFGNVLGSNGSVIPIFKKQIEEGGPVTVTHPDMRRYFMTIPEASKLVLQAATMGNGGEIFVLDMGEPVKIVDLARELITLSGYRPGEDIDVIFTGLRPGEKLFEELSIEGEDMKATRHPKISIWQNKAVDREVLLEGIEKIADIAKRQNHDEIVKGIKILVPEYIGETVYN
ncbi:UDP-N-acetyl-alpha-D-glucosamine C6 dehydratase [Limihaloglobus sulfuriphilus]|uniref:UDP-N-acetyl-alpha-D-glucosamine C6 dehydratase n=1 Tax=Limihaloglobus sulfuriphilus TaxID=1851148 RepID=A0A1Q2MBD9_9BACT|nr:nucleoside-diphosphate sugar epimerase/dehydratase [Limihaloglobus sulfuriphilus]AQQ69979.1 UDP-N-acetyl-alpha-D-glucosamine C6 dehydratase [Limihaloglobus sulfuriphilus]